MNILATLKQALEALDGFADSLNYSDPLSMAKHAKPRADSLRAAIEQMEKAEPVAWGLQMAEEPVPRQIWTVKDSAFQNAMTRWPEAYKGAYQVPLFTYPPDAQAEIERLTHRAKILEDAGNELAAYCNELRHQLSAAVTHGADLMRANEDLRRQLGEKE